MLHRAHRDGRQSAVRRRAGHAARHRSRHLSVRHVEQLRGRQCRSGSRRRPGPAALRARHHQGLYDARRQRAVPDRTADGRARHGRPSPVDRRPGARHGDRPAAPLRLARCGVAEALDDHQRRQRRCASPSSTCSTDCPRSRSASATNWMAAASTSCRSTPTRSMRLQADLRDLPRLDGSDRWRHRMGRVAAERAPLSRDGAGYIGAPIAMVSTGPDRDHTILLRHPYRA